MPAVGVGRLPPEHGAENTARIARTLINAPVCRTFLRAGFTGIITRVGTLSPASHRLRPRTNTYESAV